VNAVDEHDAEEAGPTTPTLRAVFGSLGGPRRELVVAGLAAVVSMIVIGRLARDFWFRYDNFYLVADRDISSLNDWFRPHVGHWLTWTVLVSRGLFGAFGMDYWPWWYLPRLIGHAALSFLIWRVVLQRGADRLIAFGSYLVLLFLAVSYFHDALTIANYFVFGGLIIAALLLVEVDQPRTSHLVALGAAVMAAVMGNGYGLTVLLSIAAVAALTRRLRRWAPALAVPAVAYAIWYVHYRSSFPDDQASVSLGTATDAIEPSLVVLRTAIENTLGVPGLIAAVLLVVVAAGMGWLLVQRRLDRFDAVMAVALALTLGILAVARTVPRPGTETSARYGYSVVVLGVLLVVPYLRLPRAQAVRVVVACVLVAIVAFNAVSLQRRLNEREEISTLIRTQAETTAALIVDGEPYVSYSKFGEQILPILIGQLTDTGWRPSASEDPAVLDTVRAGMRIATPTRKRIESLDIGPGDPPSAVGVDDEGCVQLEPDERLELQINGEGSVELTGRLHITWSDPFGTVEATVTGPVVGFADPVDGTEVEAVTAGARPATICGLRPA
jgi:hypothetical protein